MRLCLLAALLTALAGCCAQTSGVTPLQNDLQSVSAHVTPYGCLEPGCPKAEAIVMAQARDFCAQQNKPLSVVATNTQPSSAVYDGTTDVTFICGELPKNDALGDHSAPLPEGAVRVMP